MMKCKQSLLVALLIFVFCVAGIVANAGERSQLRAALADSGVKGGIVVHVGCGDGALTAELGADKNRLVHGLSTRIDDVKRARETIRAQGLYGRVSANLFDGKRLPYADGLVNLLIAEDLGTLSMDEVRRVLVPGGTAFTMKGGALVKTVKPWPDNIDDWSHHLHGADGNPVAEDSVVGPPQRLQWLAGPKWQRDHDTDANINALVSAGGRIFYLVDEAPISLVGPNGLPDEWSLVARDAFNGVLLWKKFVKKWGWREYKNTHYLTRHDIIPINVHRRVVASADRVYATLGFGAPVSALDAATGEVLREYTDTEETREILYDAGQLILTLPGKSGALKIKVLDASTGDLVWESAREYAGTANETSKLKLVRKPVLNASADAKSVCFIDGAEIVCLDRITGEPRWRSKPRTVEKELWAGTLIIKQGVVLYAELGLMTALSITDGSELWSREAKQPGGLWFSWKDVYVIDGLVWTWGPATGRTVTEIHGLDLKTGKVIRRVPLGSIFNVDHHHRCYRNKATSNYVIASRRGAEFIDLKGGEHSVNNWIRGICHLGMMPANGLLYAPPEPCKCYWYERVSDFTALASDPSGALSDLANLTPKPIAGPAFFKLPPKASGSEDWPTFRADSSRSGSTKSRLSAPLKSSWETRLQGPLSAPIVAQGKVFVAEVDAHTVHALDAASGKKLWHHTVGGRIDSPPTYAKGRIVFGSLDGTVTCLSAADGAVFWRFRAVPRERLIGVHSQLESAWPVHGSVLILDDVVYLTAGRSSHLDGGIHLFALALDTGEVLHRALQEGPEVDLRNDSWFDGYNDMGGRGSLSDILQLSGERVCMRNRAFARDLTLCDEPAPPHLQPLGGFLDDTYFKRYYWFYGTPMVRNTYAAMAKPQITKEQMAIALSQLLVQDESALYGVRMFESMKLLNANNYFDPGKEDYLIFKVKPAEGEPLWSQRVPIRVKAMAVTPEHLLICGPPNIVDPEDPLGAFEARKGGKFRLLSATDGATIEEHDLPSPPVFNGLAVAQGRVFISLKDGTLASLIHAKN